MQPVSEPSAQPSVYTAVRHPVALVLAVLVAVACFARFGTDPHAFVSAFASAVLVMLAAIDIDQRVLPNRIVLPAWGIVLIAQIAISPDQTLEWIAASLGAALFLFLPLLVYPSGMGLGDVKLALLLGAWLGTSVIAALMVAFFAILPASLYILVRHGGAGRKTALAFGPYLAFGAIVIGLVGGT